MRTISMAALIGALFLGAAYGTPVTFSANGSFTNGAVLSGTVTIDTATGTAVSGDLAVSGVAAHFTTLVGQSTGPSPTPFFTELDFANGQATNNVLDLLFKPVSLVGYAGGDLCHFTPANCPATNSNLFYVTFYGTSSNGVVADTSVLQAGALSLPAPDPSTFVLLGGGLGALAWKRRRLVRGSTR